MLPSFTSHLWIARQEFVNLALKGIVCSATLYDCCTLHGVSVHMYVHSYTLCVYVKLCSDMHEYFNSENFWFASTVYFSCMPRYSITHLYTIALVMRYDFALYNVWLCAFNCDSKCSPTVVAEEEMEDNTIQILVTIYVLSWVLTQEVEHQWWVLYLAHTHLALTNSINWRTSVLNYLVPLMTIQCKDQSVNSYNPLHG